MSKELHNLESYIKQGKFLSKIYKSNLMSLSRSKIFLRGVKDRRNIPYSTLSSPLVSLAKSWSLAISLKKNLYKNFSIRNYFKKDLLNFSFH